jgi:hypothetical protein
MFQGAIDSAAAADGLCAGAQATKAIPLTSTPRVLGLKRFAVISAVEGLTLTPKTPKMTMSGA